MAEHVHFTSYIPLSSLLSLSCVPNVHYFSSAFLFLCAITVRSPFSMSMHWKRPARERERERPGEKKIPHPHGGKHFEPIYRFCSRLQVWTRKTPWKVSALASLHARAIERNTRKNPGRARSEINARPSSSLALTIALIDTLADKNDDVRSSVSQSIVDTGKKLPQLAITLCTNYLNKHSKLPDTHRAAVLRVIERILSYHQQQSQQDIPFDNETFQLLTRVAITELTSPKVRSH